MKNSNKRIIEKQHEIGTVGKKIKPFFSSRSFELQPVKSSISSIFDIKIVSEKRKQQMIAH